VIRYLDPQGKAHHFPLFVMHAMRLSIGHGLSSGEVSNQLLT